MRNIAKPSLKGLFEYPYSGGYACHGDLGLEPVKFAAQLYAIVEKHLGANAQATVVAKFISNLHTNDLYLAIACAQQSVAAWNRFTAIYQKYINDLAVYFSPSIDAALELAAGVLGDMFLPDRSGHSRIASYDGRSSLATWLRVIITHRAINERERKYNTLERIECIPEIADDAGERNIEASLRAGLYEHVTADALRQACETLSDRERLMLLFRYDEEMRASHIARLLGVHPSTITRQLERIQEKLRDNMISLLASRYRLGPEAIEECLADLIENPSHSILAIIKER